MFEAFRAVADNESGERICETMTDDVCKFWMGKMHDIYECDGIKLYTMAPYPVSIGVAE